MQYHLWNILTQKSTPKSSRTNFDLFDLLEIWGKVKLYSKEANKFIVGQWIWFLQEVNGMKKIIMWLKNDNPM